MPLYHLVPEGVWRSSQRSGKPYYPLTYEQDKFIHLTEDPRLLLGVGNAFYTAKDPWEWLCLELDPAKLTGEVRYEAPAPVGSTPPPPEGFRERHEGEPPQPPLCPHLYGAPLEPAAVERELRVARDATGRFVDIEGLGVR